jgi:hypothetical protein
MQREVWYFLCKGFWIPREYRDMRRKSQSMYGVCEALQQPAAEESGSTGNEYPTVAQPFPELSVPREKFFAVMCERHDDAF